MFGNHNNKNITFSKKLRADSFRGATATVQFRNLCLIFRYLKIEIYKTIILLILYGCRIWSLIQFEGVREQGAKNARNFEAGSKRILLKLR
jgi:hypothetical protein